MTPTFWDFTKDVIFPVLLGWYLFHKLVVRRWQHEDLEKTKATQIKRALNHTTDSQ